jgi:hypothetical protein
MYGLDRRRSCGMTPYSKTICRRMKSDCFLCSSLSFAMRMKSCGTTHVLGKCSGKMICRMRRMIRKKRKTCAKARICKRKTFCRMGKTYKMRRIVISPRNNPIGAYGCI